MNRADQAPEPSMEELLASIRHIIADAGKGNTSAKEERLAHAPAGGTPAQTGSQSVPAGDDVFDLTDELVFPKDEAAPPPAPRAQETDFAPRHPIEDPKAAIPIPPAFHEGFSASARRPQGPGRPPDARPPRPESAAQARSTNVKPVWSRRELPSAASQYQAPSSRQRPDAAPAKPQTRNWAEDIQMPVPDQGPVSLFGADVGRPHRQEPEAGIERTEDEAAAVAALAQKLARSAIGALGSQELKSAQEVDFQHLDTATKADVSEKLAEAIERESAAQGVSTLPSLLDEVFRHDFIRQTEASELDSAAAEGEPDAAPATASDGEARQRKDSIDVQQSAPAAQAAPGLTEGSAPPSAATVPAAVQPLVQAQFKGQAQLPAPVQMSQTLEGAVREMLRPLLVQWLNENMPRILENAIREEIAVRGVFPKQE